MNEVDEEVALVETCGETEGLEWPSEVDEKFAKQPVASNNESIKQELRHSFQQVVKINDDQKEKFNEVKEYFINICAVKKDELGVCEASNSSHGRCADQHTVLPSGSKRLQLPTASGSRVPMGLKMYQLRI